MESVYVHANCKSSSTIGKIQSSRSVNYYNYWYTDYQHLKKENLTLLFLSRKFVTKSYKSHTNEWKRNCESSTLKSRLKKDQINFTTHTSEIDLDFHAETLA